MHFDYYWLNCKPHLVSGWGRFIRESDFPRKLGIMPHSTDTSKPSLHPITRAIFMNMYLYLPRLFTSWHMKREHQSHLWKLYAKRNSNALPPVPSPSLPWLFQKIKFIQKPKNRSILWGKENIIQFSFKAKDRIRLKSQLHFLTCLELSFSLFWFLSVVAESYCSLIQILVMTIVQLISVWR